MKAGHLRRTARASALVLLATVAAFGCAVVGFAFVIVRQAARELPEPVALSSERLIQDVVIVDREGRRIMALRHGDVHREVVPYEAISPFLRDAVVASEDARFWTHRGVDPHGIARAFLTNLRNGRKLQGGSTITQQLLKLFLLQGRPALLRKVEEAMLASAFERLLTKEQLLALYLNAVEFGRGRAGVEAASRDRFGISAAEVTLAEAAVLVGAIAAPSASDPFCAPRTARVRQQRVLRRMADEGLLAHAIVNNVAHEPVRFRLADGEMDAGTAAVVDLIETTRTLASGDRIDSSIDLHLQRASYRALREHLEVYARGRGEHRGPRAVLTPTMRDRWIANLRAFRTVLREWGTGIRELLVYDLRELPSDRSPADPCRYGSSIFRRAASQGYASGIVIEQRNDHVVLDLGDLRGTLAASSCAWTGKPLETVAPLGAIVDVRLPDQLPAKLGATVAVDLIPRPLVEGAVVVLDPRTREVLALVGGTEVRCGGYNRALDAKRPIGSTVKPFVFATALQSGVLSIDAELHDVSYRYVDPWTGQVWEPQNWYDEHLGPIPLRDAIARSVNMAAVETTLMVGTERVASLIETVSPVASVSSKPSVALGALERTPLELANAYAVFADGGRVRPIAVIRRHEEPTPPNPPSREGGKQKKISPPLAEGEREGVLDTTIIRTIDQLLREPVEHPHGTARRLKRLSLGIRGKTGTTDGARDAWFVGYTPELLVAVWVGYDQPAPLRGGRREESGGTLAVPIAEAIFAAHVATATPEVHAGGKTSGVDRRTPDVEEPATVLDEEVKP